MVESLVPDLERAFSRERLEGYRRPLTIDDLAMLTNYFWNMRLCESLMPTFHAVEVSLRNAIHDALTARFGSPMWFDEPGLLLSAERDQLANARRRGTHDIESKGHSASRLPGKIVAELSFGFWVALLGDRYQQPLWQPDGYALFRTVFPSGQGPRFQRHLVHDRLNRLRRLRNRVSHHEPIWHRGDLGDLHADAHEIIGWINPALYRAIRAVDDFAEVRRGKDRVTARLLDSLADS